MKLFLLIVYLTCVYAFDFFNMFHNEDEEEHHEKKQAAPQRSKEGNDLDEFRFM